MHTSLRTRMTVVVVSAIAILVASLASVVQVHAPRASELGVVSPGTAQTNPTIATHPPQAGFDPNTASEAALLAHGYPPRPTGGPSLAAWKTAISHATHYVAPNPTPSSVVHAPTTSSRALFTPTIEYSTIWAGHIMPQAAVGNVNFYGSWASWTQPSVPGNSNYSNSQDAPDASFWTEDYPLGTVWEGPVIRPGNTAYVSVEYSSSLSNNSGGVASYWLENETTGYYSSFDNSAPYPGWRAANFINEMVNDIYLPDFGSSVFSGCGANENNGDYWSLLTSNNDCVYMTTNGTSSGTVVSDPGAANNSTNGFTDYVFSLSFSTLRCLAVSRERILRHCVFPALIQYLNVR